MIDIEIKLKHGAFIPLKSHEADAGFDLFAHIEEEYIILRHSEQQIINTGVFVKIPEGYEFQIRGRSGLAFHEGISITHGVGTIDAGYTGEIKVCLTKHALGEYEVRDGDRIAQMVLCKVPQSRFVKWTNSETARSDNGFGSTGKGIK